MSDRLSEVGMNRSMLFARADQEMALEGRKVQVPSS